MDPVFRNRLCALVDDIDAHHDWLSQWVAKQGTQRPRAEKLACLLEGLKAFAVPHFDHFENLLDNLPQSDEPSKYPPEHVIAVILDQIAADLDVIRRAIADEVTSTTNKMVEDTLAKADQLVFLALDKVLKEGWLQQNQEVVTYFQKSADVRLFPYDNDRKTLIGIPFTSTGVPSDFLAIPHEVGHFVFWNAEIKDRPIRDILRQRISEGVDRGDLPRWVTKWTEEIFSDVYGTLVAGPSIALSFQDLQLLTSREGFTRDDGEHPAPAVRPYAYTMTLRKMGLTEWAAELDSLWRTRLNERGNPQHIILEQAGLPVASPTLFRWFDRQVRFPMRFIISPMCWLLNCHKVTVSDARAATEQVVEIVFDLLKSVQFDGTSWDGIDYSQEAPVDKGQEEGEEQLYENFAGFIGALKVAEPTERTKSYQQAACRPIDYDVWLREKTAQMTAYGGGWGCYESDDPPWCRLWIADGWATKGPQGSWF